MYDYLAQISVFISIFLLLAASLNLVLGFGGIFSIMQAAFFGTGAYAAALLILDVGAPFPLDLVGAFVASAVLAAAVAVLIMRLSSELIIIGTLALQLVLSAVFRNWTAVTGGSYGIYGIGPPSLFGEVFSSAPSYAALAAIIAALCFGVALWIGRSPFGLALRAQREDPVLASSFGHDPVREKRGVFVLSGGIAGVAGGLYAQYVGYIDPSSFDITQSLSIITITVIGGLANLWGTLGATAVLTLIPQFITLLPAASDAAAQLQLLLYGVILVVIVRFWPHGLIPEQPAVRATRFARPTAKSVGPAAAASGALDYLASVSVPALRETAPTISVSDVRKHFGGIRAVDGVSLEIPARARDRAHRPERRRKDDAFQRAVRPAAVRRRPGRVWRPRDDPSAPVRDRAAGRHADVPGRADICASDRTGERLLRAAGRRCRPGAGTAVGGRIVGPCGPAGRKALICAAEAAHDRRHPCAGRPHHLPG